MDLQRREEDDWGSFADQLDPVPVSFAPSPISRNRTGETFKSQWTEGTPADKNGSGQFSKAVERSPETMKGSYSEYTPPAALRPSSGSVAPVESKSSPNRNDVEVSPPTPAVVREAAGNGVERNYDVPPRTPAVGGGPIQSLLSQLALPTMRNNRPDFFQGHSGIMQRQQESSSTLDPMSATADAGGSHLRNSELHDRLERDLMEFQQRQQHHQSVGRGPTSRAHYDPSVPQMPITRDTAPGDVSGSKLLLQQLATKRVPR
jgi:hypothetical protein